MNTAGISTRVMKKKTNTRVEILARGNFSRYAPITPGDAPLAPIMGAREPHVRNDCVNAAAIPHSR